MTLTTPSENAADAIGQDEELARIEVVKPVSIIVPTYKEVENIPLLIERVRKLRSDSGVEAELIFMDDSSCDGSVEAVANCGHDWVRIVERHQDRGLSPAVIDGFRIATNPVLVCMDCDLSHPPEKIPQMVYGLSAGQQMVIGSRYVPGGSTDDDWGFFRWLNSRVATLLARPLTAVSDPMSGFFALRRRDFDRASELNPVGYKIALELIVKCGFENVGEVPIHFSDRVHGESKLTLREQLKYIQHLRRLYLFRFANAMYLLQFLVVGALGVVVNLVVLTLLLMFGLGPKTAIAGGIVVSVCTNFLLNRRFTFSYARDRNPFKQFLGFVAASAVGMAVNFLVSIYLIEYVLDDTRTSIYIASLCGIATGMLFNFLGNRYLVFRKRYIQ
ncbi:glycosyltransferase [Paracoccus salsus]|uniref:glycosyltransferase n=1 Tax=Paracoccus salsus TaxID=2911061 RepID=UPI001F1EE8C0|nr:glycosyltransferase family 2 protein [Paracoccus salsus]MCF3973239.1 glycosyltransferase family 2 protein [Paracoccus salsus]